MKTKFQIQCEKIAEELDASVMFFDDDRKQNAVEDDGNLHVTKRGLRACFDAARGQSLPPKEQNIRTCAILKALGMEKEIGKMTLVDEVEDDEDCCPHCGREL